MSNTNSNLGSAVLQLIKNAGAEGITFAALVRELRKRNFDPSMDEVRGELREIYAGTGKLFLRDGLRICCPDNAVIACKDGADILYIVQLVPTDHVAEYFDGDGMAAVNTDDEMMDADGVIGYFSTAADAYRAAYTDLFCLSGARMVWKADTDVYMWQLQYMQAYTIAPVMPPLDAPIAATDDMWIKAELDAVQRALVLSLNENDYRRLRDDAVEGVLKLSFSVKVNTKNRLCGATMSGNIKLSNDVALRIEDPAQMKINFGEGGAA